MIQEFKYYLENQLAKKSSPDKGEAEALMSKATGRLEFSIRARKINNNTAPYIFEDVYECLREAGQALMSIKGYKPYSHEALISFLEEFFSFSESEISTLNRYRVLRNKTVYQGERISAETALEALRFLQGFLPKLKKEFDKIAKS
ncbi:hypothetical protein JW756_02980 [Candidatus Woesearchaeota archaeon]|nr:hypothetical protein [Candidatus Woesearchaeota archaeon]